MPDPTVPLEQDTPPPQQTTPPSPPAEDAEPEGTVDVGGQKMVPIGVVHGERAKRKEAQQQMQQLGQWVQSVRPHIERLQQHPQLLDPNYKPAPAAPPPTEDPELVAYAERFDLYTRDGQPDVKRAKAIRDDMRRDAQEAAQQAVQPFVQATEHDRSQANLRSAKAFRTPDGRAADPATLDQIWQSMPERLTADPAQASVLMYAALGYAATTTPPTSPLTTPLYTETPGSRIPQGGQRGAPSTLETNVMALRGIDAKKHAEYLKNFRPGEANVLEAD